MTRQSPTTRPLSNPRRSPRLIALRDVRAQSLKAAHMYKSSPSQRIENRKFNRVNKDRSSSRHLDKFQTSRRRSSKAWTRPVRLQRFPIDCRAKNLPKRYRNTTRTSEKDDNHICDHAGPCVGTQCACAQNSTVCREGCKCSANCIARFPPCDCVTECRDDGSCSCRLWQRECTVRCSGGQCSTIRCDNVYTAREPPPTKAKDSENPIAGTGLFAVETIPRGAFVGIYSGVEVFHDTEPTEHVRLFEVSKLTAIQPTKECQVYFINHKSRSEGANAEFRVFQGSYAPIVVCHACKEIAKGEEIWAPYFARKRDAPEWATQKCK